VDTLVLMVVCAAAALVILSDVQIIDRRRPSPSYQSGDITAGAANSAILPLQLVAPYSMGFCSDGTWDAFFRAQRDGSREV